MEVPFSVGAPTIIPTIDIRSAISTLAHAMYTRAIRLILIIAAILLTLGGTLSFAWVFLALETDKAQKIIQTVSFFLFAAVLAVAALDDRYSWSNLSATTKMIGAFTVIIGFILRLLTFRENVFASTAVELMPDQRTITSGPYTSIRHPMYLSVLMILSGASLTLGSKWSLLVCIPLCLVIAWRALKEEQFLRAGLPQYADYMRSVPYRFLPLIW